MPGFLVHQGAVVLCSHAGQAQPAAPNPRVLVSGMPVVTAASPYVVAGCAQAAIPAPPCVSAQFVTFAARVLVAGQPALLLDSQSVCAPTGTPLLIVTTQTRVTGT